MKKLTRREKKLKKQREKRSFRQAMNKELREHKSSFFVFYILRFLVLVVLVRQAVMRNYESMFFCILTILLLYVPSWIQVKLRIELPPALEITVLCFIFAAEILGEVNAFYVKINNWDTMLHTLNGFLAAAVGFSMVLLLNDDERLTFDLSPLFLALVAFCFSMTIGVLWEFFEFGMDYFFGTDMQKDTVIHALHTVALDTTRTCDMEVGQTFVANGWERPEGFCPSAWDTLSPFVLALSHGAENFYDGWMKNPRSAMLSCNDGFRPVSFLVEALDEDAD